MKQFIRAEVDGAWAPDGVCINEEHTSPLTGQGYSSQEEILNYNITAKTQKFTTTEMLTEVLKMNNPVKHRRQVVTCFNVATIN